MDKEAVVAKAGFMAFEGAKPEQVIRFLHESGFNVVDSILALRRTFGVSVGEGKEALLNSGLWGGSREQFEQAATEAEKLAAEEQNAA